jgi:hypothetical protein
MSTDVFILGAGASQQAGAPLMLEFLDTAHNLWKLKRVPDVEPSFDSVFQGISSLQSVHSKSQLDIQNLESVFAAFEMANTIGKFGVYSKETIKQFVESMKVVIAKTIEKTVFLPVKPGKIIEAPPPYGNFEQLIEHLTRSAQPQHTVSIITFNYDMAVDYAFHRKLKSIDYGFSDTPSGGMPILKLHGSINWAECSVCHVVAPVTLEEYFKKYLISFFDEDIQRITLDIGSHLSGFKHVCGGAYMKNPAIVPPTWDKSQYRKNVASVWARAAQELSQAENIYVIGFSLPPTDSFFKYLYALGSVGTSILKRFWVFDIDDSGKVEGRFRELLGPGASQRFKYHKEDFSKAIVTLRHHFPGPKH